MSKLKTQQHESKTHCTKKSPVALKQEKYRTTCWPKGSSSSNTQDTTCPSIPSQKKKKKTCPSTKKRKNAQLATAGYPWNIRASSNAAAAHRTPNTGIVPTSHPATSPANRKHRWTPPTRVDLLDTWRARGGAARLHPSCRHAAPDPVEAAPSVTPSTLRCRNYASPRGAHSAVRPCRLRCCCHREKAISGRRSNIEGNH